MYGRIDISNLTVAQYKADLAKVFKKMHMRLVREIEKKERIEGQDEVMIDYEVDSDHDEYLYDFE